MKKLIVSFLTLLSLTMLANAVFAETGKITANATKSKYVNPDTATISFTVETQDKNSQKAVEINNEKVKSLVEVLKQQLTENEVIKTSSYNLSQNYEYTRTLGDWLFAGSIVEWQGDEAIFEVRNYINSGEEIRDPDGRTSV